MTVLAAFIGSAFLFAALNVFLLRFNKPGSDHYFHISMIRAIKQNRHNFVLRHPQLCGQKYNSYPILLHWLLSFLPSRFLKRGRYSAASVFIIILQVTFYLSFVLTAYPLLSICLDKQSYLLLAGLVYATFPFSYALWNAKNTGISARGFGLVLGQCYLYSIWYYSITQNLYILLVSSIIAFLTLIGSQFAAQMVILTAPVLTLLSGDLLYLVIPPAALGIYFLTMPQYCINYCRGQFWHKYIFCLYLAPAFLWEHRYSIWRDFVYDIWAQRGLRQRIRYALNNPMISLFVGIPMIVLLTIVICCNPTSRSTLLNSPATNSMLVIVLATVVVFLLTSFRRTRFLGEPERYVEFAIPFISVLAILLYDPYAIWLYSILACSFIAVIIQILLSLRKCRSGVPSRDAMLDVLSSLKTVITNSPETVRLFSNNQNLLAFAQGLCEYFTILRININSLHTGTLHFRQIYPVRYGTMSREAAVQLMKEFRINWYIHDTRQGTEIPSSATVQLDKQFMVGTFHVYKVCCANSVNHS